MGKLITNGYEYLYKVTSFPRYVSPIIIKRENPIKNSVEGTEQKLSIIVQLEGHTAV